jgi:hypothetical protein
MLQAEREMTDTKRTLSAASGAARAAAAATAGELQVVGCQCHCNMSVIADAAAPAGPAGPCWSAHLPVQCYAGRLELCYGVESLLTPAHRAAQHSTARHRVMNAATWRVTRSQHSAAALAKHGTARHSGGHEFG